MTISEKFASLLASIQPSHQEDAALDDARQQLTTFFTQQVETARLLPIGSYSRGTAIAGNALDLLQVISRKDATWGGLLTNSNTVLANLREHLALCEQTELREDNAALVITYKSGAQINLIPGYYSGPGPSNYPIYQIPNGAGSWISASPASHDDFIESADRRAHARLKPTIQLLKYWSQCRISDVPLNSFQLEVALASSGVCVSPADCSECVAEALAELAARAPVGVAGLIPASATLEQRAAVTGALVSCSDHAARALRAQHDGLPDEAHRQWSLVFNAKFP